LNGQEWFAKAGHSFQGTEDDEPGEGGAKSIAEEAEQSVEVKVDESSPSWLL